MNRNYSEFKERLERLEQNILLVPGNWDGKSIDDSLAKYNIHNKYYEKIEDVKFIGYGGSNSHPIELPFDLTINYNSDELFNHLCKFDDAEVVLTHEVPRGFEGGLNYKGEYSLLAYLFRNAPALILTGHIHRPFVSREPKTGTIVANPGNLGRFNDNPFGTFLELEIDKNTFVRPLAFHKINGDSVESHEIKTQAE